MNASSTILTHRRRARERRGFAAIFALTLIILVGAALVALGANFAMEASRTRSQAAEAQLRQLLTAGAAAATARAETAGPAKPVELPTALTSQGASVSVQISGDGDDRSAIVAAQFNQRRMEQTLKLHRGNNRWSIAGVDLDGAAQPPASTQPSERSTAASQRS